jgi:hypothetical protein
LQEKACVNALFLSVFSWGSGTAGRQVRGQPLPDHGKQEYDSNFHGGNYATVHPQYYRETGLRPEDTRAPDHGKLDILEAVLPVARKRGIQTFCWAIDKIPPSTVANAEKLQERDLHDRSVRTFCFRNPYHRNFLMGLTEDQVRSYEIDGLMWSSERPGPLTRALGAYHGGRNSDPGRVTCFCEFCRRAARERGINVERALEGYRALENLVRECRSGKRPLDGYYVRFWRLILRYPEIIAWETLWMDGLQETYRAIFEKAKSVRKDVQVGWHIAHSIALNPIYRAEHDLRELSRYSDFIKVVLYQNAAGERMASYIDSMSQTLWGDLSPQQSLELEYRIMGYGDEGRYERLAFTGLSPDYIERETKRAIQGVVDSNTAIWPGIDIDVPTEPNHSRSTRLGTKTAVAAVFRAGAPGIVLSRKYSEMRLDNLSGAGDALREIGAG